MCTALQGDKETELELPISPLCDRKNTMISESQIGIVISSLFVDHYDDDADNNNNK